MRLLKCFVFFGTIVFFAASIIMPFYKPAWYIWVPVTAADIVLVCYMEQIFPWMASWMVNVPEDPLKVCCNGFYIRIEKVKGSGYQAWYTEIRTGKKRGCSSFHKTKTKCMAEAIQNCSVMLPSDWHLYEGKKEWESL